MEKNLENKACWYQLVNGQCLQGVLLQQENEYRVYIVTIEPDDLALYHYRWPHVVHCKTDQWKI